MNAADQRRAWTPRDTRMATVTPLLAKVICAGSMSSVQNPIAVLQASFDSSWPHSFLYLSSRGKGT